MPILVSVDRLKEIAETDFEDVEDQAKAVRDLAVAVLQVMHKAQQQPAPPPQRTAPQQQSSGGRVKGKPIPPELRRTTCKQCHDDVVVFISRMGKPYLCDIELSVYENKRQQLSGVNWLHKCGGGR